MKEDLRVWYEGLDYEEGFGPGEVHHSQPKKKQIDTYVITCVLDHG